MKRIACILLIACAGCSHTNISQFQEKFGNGHNVLVNKLSTIYGTDNFIYIGQQTNTDVTVSPDGTVTVKSH